MYLFCLTRMSRGSLCLAPAGHARCFRVNTSLRNKDENLNSILALYWCYDNHLHIPVINSHDLQLLGFSSWVVIKLEKAGSSSLCKNSVLPRDLNWYVWKTIQYDYFDKNSWQNCSDVPFCFNLQNFANSVIQGKISSNHRASPWAANTDKKS